jgi:hypothetical protein
MRRQAPGRLTEAQVNAGTTGVSQGDSARGCGARSNAGGVLYGTQLLLNRRGNDHLGVKRKGLGLVGDKPRINGSIFARRPCAFA